MLPTSAQRSYLCTLQVSPGDTNVCTPTLGVLPSYTGKSNQSSRRPRTLLRCCGTVVETHKREHYSPKIWGAFCPICPICDVCLLRRLVVELDVLVKRFHLAPSPPHLRPLSCEPVYAR